MPKGSAVGPGRPSLRLLGDRAVAPARRPSGAGPMMLRARFADGSFTQIEMAPRIGHRYSAARDGAGPFRLARISRQSRYRGVPATRGRRRAGHHGAQPPDHLGHRQGSPMSRASARRGSGSPPRSSSACSASRNISSCRTRCSPPGAGRRDIEFIYVSNSPELAETLHKEARIAERIYGLERHSGHPARQCRVQRRQQRGDPGGPQRPAGVRQPGRVSARRGLGGQHAAILETQAAQRRPGCSARRCIYDDGSLMHGGMYFEHRHAACRSGPTTSCPAP